MAGMGMTPEVAAAFAAQQQFPAPAAALDQQQLHQMSAMMAMAAAAGAANAANASGTTATTGGSTTTGPSSFAALGMPGMPSGAQGALPMLGAPGAPFAPLPPMPLPGHDSGVPAGPFSSDPVAAQAYAQMYASLAQAYAQCGMDAASGNLAAPGQSAALPAPFPSVTTTPPYNPAATAATTPTISVAVDGMKFQYQLTPDDLHKVFSRYGSVSNIIVDEAGTSAQITFQDYQSAQAAMSDLNGKVLNGLEGTLRITWTNFGTAGSGGPAPPYTMMPGVSPPLLQNWGFPGASGTTPWLGGGAGAGMHMAGQQAGAPDIANVLAMGSTAHGSLGPGGQCASAGHGRDGSGSPNGFGGSSSALDGPDARHQGLHVKGVRKHTCRFLIGIDNDRDFAVVRRIIGAKGANMKRIVRQTETTNGFGGAKLRLRGVGSGYYEGAGQRESSEPLQLCISCTSPDGFKTAVRLVEELLEAVYTDYRQWCRENGKPEPTELHANPQLVGGSGWQGCGDGAEHNDDDDDEGADGDSGMKREGRSRRRGRRGPAKKSDSKPSAERGDPPPKAPPVEEIERMIDARNEARRQCNFTEADRIRQNLHERGVALMDEPGARGKGAEVTTWRYWRE